MSVLKNFTIVDLVKTRSASVATITGNTLKLNPQTAGELRYAPFVQVLVNPKEKQFAIRACKEGDINAVPFSAIWSDLNGRGGVTTALFASERSKFAFSVARQHGNNEKPTRLPDLMGFPLKRKEVIWIIQFRIFSISDPQKHGLFSEI